MRSARGSKQVGSHHARSRRRSSQAGRSSCRSRGHRLPPAHTCTRGHSQGQSGRVDRLPGGKGRVATPGWIPLPLLCQPGWDGTGPQQAGCGDSRPVFPDRAGPPAAEPPALPGGSLSCRLWGGRAHTTLSDSQCPHPPSPAPAPDGRLESPHVTQGEALLSAGCQLVSAGVLVDTARVGGTAHGQAEQAEETFWPHRSPSLAWSAAGPSEGLKEWNGLGLSALQAGWRGPACRDAGRRHPSHSPRPQSVPRNPAGQRQAPVTASQEPPLRHPHSSSQPGPNRPGGHPAGGGASCQGRGARKAPPLSPPLLQRPGRPPGSTHVAGSRRRGSRGRMHRPPRRGGRPGSRRGSGTAAHSAPQRCQVGRLGEAAGVSPGLARRRHPPSPRAPLGGRALGPSPGAHVA